MFLSPFYEGARLSEECLCGKRNRIHFKLLYRISPFIFSDDFTETKNKRVP